MPPTIKSRHFTGVTEWRPLTAASLEARMERHRRWQHARTHALIEEVIDEVLSLPQKKPSHSMALPFCEEFDTTPLVPP